MGWERESWDFAQFGRRTKTNDSLIWNYLLIFFICIMTIFRKYFRNQITSGCQEGPGNNPSGYCLLSIPYHPHSSQISVMKRRVLSFEELAESWDSNFRGQFSNLNNGKWYSSPLLLWGSPCLWGSWQKVSNYLDPVLRWCFLLSINNE